LSEGHILYILNIVINLFRMGSLLVLFLATFLCIVYWQHWCEVVPDQDMLLWQIKNAIGTESSMQMHVHVIELHKVLNQA